MSEYLTVGGIRDRGTIVALNAYWQDIRHAYDASGNLIYRGVHYDHDIATSDSGWEVWKYTWGSDGITRIEGPIKGSWDNRATLGWGA